MQVGYLADRRMPQLQLASLVGHFPESFPLGLCVERVEIVNRWKAFFIDGATGHLVLFPPDPREADGRC